MADPTSDEISKLCGDVTISVPSFSSGTSITPSTTLGSPPTVSMSTNSSSSYQSRREQLAQDIRRMKDDQFLLFVDSAPGMYLPARRKPYWRMKYGSLASPDPYHPGGPLVTPSRLPAIDTEWDEQLDSSAIAALFDSRKKDV